MNFNAPLLLICLSATTISSCGDDPSKEAANARAQVAVPSARTIAIPLFKERTVEIGPLDERDQLLDAYDNARIKLEKTPEDLGAWLKMAEVFITEARITGEFGYNYNTALEIIDHVKEKGTDKPDILEQAMTLEALILLSQHQFKEAAEIGNKILAMNPHRAFNHGIMVDANVELGNYEQAVKASDAMVAMRPDLRSYSRVSYLREIHGEVQGAVDAMEMAIKAGYPGFEETSWCRVMMGGLEEGRGDLKKAEDQYLMALAERPDYPFAQAALGRVEMKRRNYLKAEELIKKAIAQRPEASFYTDLAHLYKAQGKTDEFNAARDKARVQLKGLSNTRDSAEHHEHDDHAHAHDHVAGHDHDHTDGSPSDGKHEHVHQHDGGEHHGHNHDDEPAGHAHGDDSHAHDDHSHAGNAHGHSHEVGLEMARLELDLFQNYGEALHNIEYEFERRPNNIEVDQVLATIHYKMNNLERAAEFIAKAQSTGIKDAKTMGLAGLIKMAQGEKAEGKKLIALSLKTDPYQMGPLADEMRRVAKS